MTELEKKCNEALVKYAIENRLIFFAVNKNELETATVLCEKIGVEKMMKELMPVWIKRRERKKRDWKSPLKKGAVL